MRKTLYLIMAAAVIMAGCTPLFASGYAKGQVLVIYYDTASPSAAKSFQAASLNKAAAIAKSAGAALTAAYPKLTEGTGETIAVITSAAKTGDELAAELAKNPQVKAVARNYAHKLTVMQSTPNDPGYEQQWGPKRIGADAVWSADKEVKEVYAAVLDTGVMYDHPDLAANMCGKLPDGSYGKMFHYPINASLDVITSLPAMTTAITRGGTPKADIASPDIPGINYATVGDINGHGTHVAGIIGAVQNNGIGVSGVARKVKILPVGIFTLGHHILEGNITPEYFGAMNYDSSLIEALSYLVTLKKIYGVNVVVANMSIGDWMDDSYNFDQNTNPVALAIKAASDAGILVCMAAGNDGQDLNSPTREYVGYKEYPATFRFDATLAVGASASDDKRGYIIHNGEPFYFSNYSSKENLVDLFAPGSYIYSTTMSVDIGGTGNYSREGYAAFSGTSMATPMTAGAAALLASIYPEKSAVEIKSLLLQGTERNVLREGNSAHGMLNVYNSYKAASGEGGSSGGCSAGGAVYALLFIFPLALATKRCNRKDK